MKKQMTAAMAAVLMMSTLQSRAQQTTGSTGTAGTKHSTRRKAEPKKDSVDSEILKELHELKDGQAAMQAEIDQLKAANAAKDAALAQANATAVAATTQAQTATAEAESVTATVQAQKADVDTLKSNVTDLQTTSTGLAQTISSNKQEITASVESPTSIHYKGITITPVAFFAFEGVYRDHAINSDINTPLNTIPFPGSNQGHISELNFSGRQSRLGGIFEGKTEKAKLTGYFESDFLGAGVTSNNNQSNSYLLRVRQMWGKAETPSGFAVTGGQTWSLVTENRASTDVRTEIQPQTIDPQYLVGYNWTRQPGIRLQQKLGGADQKTGVTVAMSLEQAQIQLGSTANAPANFIFGGVGQGGGLYNGGGSVTIGSTNTLGNLTAYANNVAPDVLVKAAFDAKMAHVEIGGIARFFRDELYPLIVTTTGGTTTTSFATNVVKNTKVGGGVFGAARVYAPGKKAEFAIQAMAGEGTARYGSSQLGDVTVHPDGTLEPIRNYHGLFSAELHPRPNFDIFAYFGGEYNQRTYYVSPTGTLVGYGVPNQNDTGCYALTIGSPTGNGVAGAPGAVANCGSPTKSIEEGMFGFQWRPIISPKYGRLQYSATYSYIEKTTWTGVLSGTFATGFLGSGRATDGMVHVQMRYYIP